MENQQKPVPSDEIDLGVLFSKIGDFFGNVGMGVMRGLANLRQIPIQNKTLFIVLIIVFSGVAYLYSSGILVKKYYETSMILSSDYLNKRILDNTIDKLNLLAGEKYKKGLAKTLQISDSVAENILSFKAKPFIAEDEVVEIEILKMQLQNATKEAKNEKVITQVINRIQLENRHSFEITARVGSPQTISNLEKTLLNYFRNDEYIKKRIDINKVNLTAKKQKLVQESQKLDSLKRVIFQNYQSMAQQSRQGSNNVILSDKAVTNPIEIYNQDISIYNEIQSIDKALFIQPDFEVVSSFTEFTEPASASVPKAVVISMVIAIGLGYLIVALLNFNKYLASLV
jgi:hypothetical protein